MNDDAGAWIDTRRGVEELARRLQTVESYCLDTEFHRERTYFPQLALIQINVDDEIFLVDPTAVDLDVIATLFENDALVILHAAQQDLDVLQLTCGTRLASIRNNKLRHASWLGMSA